MEKKRLNKKLIFNILWLIILGSLLIGVTSTYAWYQSQMSYSNTVNVDADGFTTLYFDSAVVYIDESDMTPEELEKMTFIPAVAKPGYVTNGIDVDPLNIDQVDRLASVVSFDMSFTLTVDMAIDINYKIGFRQAPYEEAIEYDLSEFAFVDMDFGYDKKVSTPLMEDGDYVFEMDNGTFVYKDSVDAIDGYYYDDNGDETYLADASDTTQVFDVVFVETDAIKEQDADFTHGVLHIANSSTIRVSAEAYLAKIDELIDPQIKQGPIFMTLTVWI